MEICILIRSKNHSTGNSKANLTPELQAYVDTMSMISEKCNQIDWIEIRKNPGLKVVPFIGALPASGDALAIRANPAPAIFYPRGTGPLDDLVIGRTFPGGHQAFFEVLLSTKLAEVPDFARRN
ncbi:hypothetical protein F5B21DRAFT_505810 [Xylaria acuta]|nr:hypothetical protein F5B21DRAFT_505810 [Xylaria acuta]